MVDHPQEATACVVVGLDVGTTATKAVAFGLSSSWRHVAVREYPLLEPAPGRQVQEPATVLDAAVSALAEAVAASAGAEVVAVSVSAAMHGLVALDADLEPLTPLVTWADARATDVARRLRTGGQGPELHRRTGTPVHPMSPLTKIVWFREHEPDLAAAARWWVGLKELLLLRLTGRLATELSSASATGLLDLRTRDWDPAALALAGTTADQLPPVLAPTAILPLSPTAAEHTGLPVGTPVVVGAADGPLGNLGSGAIGPGVAGLSLGTSAAVRAVVPEPRVDDAGRLFCYALTESAWVVGGALSNGGVVVRWAGSALAPDLAAGGSPDEALLELAATAPPGCEGLVMLPYLLAARAPLWDPALPGAYLGLRREHTRAHLVRAAVEGVALQLATVTEELDRLEPVRSVRATGGAFRSPLWQAVVAAALDRPLHVVGDAEGTAAGAAALALLALGRADTLAEAIAALSPTGSADAEVRPDPTLVDAHRRARAALPLLVDALGPVADLLR